MGMTDKEKEKTKLLREKLKKYKDFDRDAWLIIGAFAFCKESDEYGGSEHILDEMIKLVEKNATLEGFMADIGTLVGIE